MLVKNCLDRSAIRSGSDFRDCVVISGDLGTCFDGLVQLPMLGHVA